MFSKCLTSPLFSLELLECRADDGCHVRTLPTEKCLGLFWGWEAWGQQGLNRRSWKPISQERTGFKTGKVYRTGDRFHSDIARRLLLNQGMASSGAGRP